MIDNSDDITLRKVSRPLRRFGKIDQPYPFPFQGEIEKGGQGDTGCFKNIAGFRVRFTVPPRTGRTALSGKPVSCDSGGTDGITVRIEMTKNINQRCIPVKGSIQARRIYERPDIPPEIQESYQASSAPDGAVGKGGTPSP